MKRRLCVHFLLALGLLALWQTISPAPPLFAQSSYTAAVQGSVTDAATGAPIVGAVVTVTGGYVAATAADGSFSIPAITLTADYGIVSVTITAAGYGPYTLSDTAIFANDALLLTVQLGPDPQTYEAGGLLDQFGRDLPDEITDPLPQADGVQPQFWSHSVIPPTIRVAITGRSTCGYRGSDGRWVYYPIQRVDVVDFRQYVKNVLPSEWISTWNGQSHRAGAVAVKMYAWWKMNIGPRTIGGFTFDVWGDTCDQMYIAGRSFASTNAAVDDTWNYLMRRNGQVFKIHYTSTDDVCRANNLSPCMSQWGSKALGDQGFDWQYILNYYYSPIEITYGASLPPTDTNLVRNSTFADGFSSWFYGGDMPLPTVSSGALSTTRSRTVTNGWAAVFQDLGHPIISGAPFEMTVRLNNTSPGVRDVQIAIRNNETWAGAISCAFALPSGVGFQTFTLRGQTPNGWPNIRAEIDLLTPDTALQIDDVTVQYKPGLAVSGTACIRPSPANDLFANRTIIPAGGAVMRQLVLGATVTSEDPALTCLGGDGRGYSESVWFQFTPAVPGTVQLNTAGSGFDAALGVFRVDGGGGLSPVTCSDNFSASATAAYVTFEGAAGTPYAIQVVRRAGPVSGQLVLAANRIGLLSPGGLARADYGSPVYTWTDMPTDYYYLYVQTRVGQQVINEVLARDETLCSGGLCQLDAARLRERYRLPEGDYDVYMNTWRGGVPGEVVGPFSFTLDAAPPALVTMTAPEATDTARPRITWMLDDATASATYFYVYVAPSDNIAAGVYYTRHTRQDACGSAEGRVCGATASVDLPSAVAYSAFVGACGIGGCATVGGPYNNGYAGPALFTVALARPGLPQNLRAEVVGTQPMLRWDDQPDALRSAVAIYDWANNRWLTYSDHARMGDPALTCDGITCTFLPDPALFLNGSYSFFVNATGAGGPSQGGPFGNGFTGPQNQADTSEAGDFTVALPAPPLVETFTAPTGTITSGSPTLEWPTVPDATYYNIWVGTLEPFQAVHYQWYTAKSANCTPHPGVCRLRVALNLPPNRYGWNVQPAGPGGVAGWGVGMAFVVDGSVPGLPTLLAPAGDVTEFAPIFTWNELPTAETYRLWVGNPTVTQTYHFAEYDRSAICSAGQCRVQVPGMTLYNGAYLWNAWGVNAAGAGPWPPAGQTFRVAVPAPVAPALISPADDAILYDTNRPALTWNTVPYSQGYLVEVFNSGGGVVYSSLHFANPPECSEASCTIRLPNPIGYGSYRWRVTPGNLNEAGTASATWDFFSLSFNTQPLALDTEDSRITRAGEWTTILDERALGGSFLTNIDTPRINGVPALALAVEGTQVDVLYIAAPGYGRFTIEIDGTAFQTVETSAFEITHGQIATVRGLPAGVHTVRLVAEGTVALDAVLIDGRLVELLPTATPLPTEAPESTPEATPEATSALPPERTTEPTPEGTSEPPAPSPVSTLEGTLEGTPALTPPP